MAARARAFGEAFGAGAWAETAGLWHDIGKHSAAFQRYLESSADPDSHRGEITCKVDHSTAGAQHSVRAIPILGHLLAYVIAGHHSGLLDGRSDGACQECRLAKNIEDWSACPDSILVPPDLPLPPFVQQAFASRARDPFSLAFFVRMLFSCVVDADFLDTEEFLDSARSATRPRWPRDAIEQMAEALGVHLRDLQAKARAEHLAVNEARSGVLGHCLEAASRAPGVFSLTVPTGGGKTLSSLAFALEHARRYHLDRVIYVVPLTSIIEQNAGVFRSVFAVLARPGFPDPVLEHHSALDAGLETDASRLAAENWGCPLVITTAVQFYESLFASRASRCRKLHNIARSVVILDEAQTLPVDFLHPCLRTLRELAANYGSTIVLCTATQPAINRREDFPIGLEGVREIIPDPARLHLDLRRVEVGHIGPLDDDSLAARLRQHRQVLCVVNTRNHARALFESLEQDDTAYHLSALMCPEHRAQVLEVIRERLQSDQECRVISTQLVEAGVDIDFPVVFRSLAGVDSIAQAAGRCNRNGRLVGLGRTFVFRSEHGRSEQFLRDTTNVTEQVLRLHPDPLPLEAVELYFRLYYWDQTQRWDSRGILDKYHLVQDPEMPFLFDFASVSERFHLIEDSGRPVIIPWKEEGRSLCEELRARPPDRKLLRRLQRYTVTIPVRLWWEHADRSMDLVHQQYPVLFSPEAQYSEHLGLVLDGGHDPYLQI